MLSFHKVPARGYTATGYIFVIKGVSYVAVFFKICLTVLVLSAVVMIPSVMLDDILEFGIPQWLEIVTVVAFWLSAASGLGIIISFLYYLWF